MVAKAVSADIFCGDTFQMALQFTKWLSLTWFLSSGCSAVFLGGERGGLQYFSPISFDDKTLFSLEKVVWSFPPSSIVLNSGSLHQLL